MKYKFYFLFCSLFSFFTTVRAQTINLQQVVGTGLSSPIGVYFAPGDNNTMYIIQQGGRIKIANATTGVVSGTDFINLTSKVTSAGNEQGLLGLAFHPDYANNGYFYVNYTRSGNGATVVARYKRNTANPMTADIASEDIVIQISQPYSNHNGGQIQFGRDGYLYIGMGDGGSGGDPQGNAQNGQSLLGKMLRLDVDDSGYTIPPDNPFLTDNNRRDEIWAVGVRNPWRFSFDKVSHGMWIADVGQESWEEVNFEPAATGGRNYGWRCYEGNVTYNTAGCQGANAYTSPVAVYSSGTGSSHCSITGGFVYRGGSFASLYGKYIYTDYCSGQFWTTAPDGAGGWTTTPVTTTPQLTFQLASFGQDHNGEMYVVSREGNKIYRLVGTPCAPADIYSTSGSLQSCTGNINLEAPYAAGNTYQWYRNDTLLAGQTDFDLTATMSGIYKVEVANGNNACGGDTSVEVIIASSTPASVSLPAAAYCADAAAVNITASPAGGTLSGPGVAGSSFSPTGLTGDQNIVYSYTNNQNCTTTDTFTVTVNPLPNVNISVTLPPTVYCLNDQASITAAPAGGTFTGPGMTGNQFNAGTAGVGNHTITYSYTDANGCSNSTTANLTVNNCYTSIAEAGAEQSLTVFPNPFTDEIQIQLEGKKNITILSVDGKVLYKKQQTSTSVPLEFLPAGSYILRVEQGGKFYQNIIVKGK